ncbi:hypothetical protein [Dyadobacter arcticus]|uniref:Uncharacterized protein n=1 Tax=Dyadobacter arcticus TaxID=1078754 RepID=A0ABX0UH45_9BACT|nr:hypothetical protein [Dyadobacter arcticus]NIJ51339.1 hypothetical protein [Dyadobacter arcticus]
MLLSCGSEQTNDKNEKYYYDLKGFVDNQIVYLDEKKPMVYKTTMLNGKKEIGKSTNIDWKKELELFIQADINKPAYRQSYDVVRKDSSEYEYTLRPNMNLPVRYLKIVTDKSINQPLYVKALLKSENKIYDSEKSIELICTKANNLWELKSFSVHGYQKLIFMDKKLFQIESKIGL